MLLKRSEAKTLKSNARPRLVPPEAVGAAGRGQGLHAVDAHAGELRTQAPHGDLAAFAAVAGDRDARDALDGFERLGRGTCGDVLGQDGVDRAVGALDVQGLAQAGAEAGDHHLLDSAARRVIQGVTNMHSRVVGQTPFGEGYKALDTELLDWVSATAGYGFLNAYDRFVSPISEADKTRFYAEAGPIAALYGVRYSPGSTADFLAMMDRLAPRFEPHPIVGEFLDIIQSGKAAPNAPKFLHRALARGAVSLLPPIVRQKLALGREYDLGAFDRLALKAAGKLADRIPVPGSPPCKASVRLGLPADFLYRRPAEQRRLLATLSPLPDDGALPQAS
jgi:hypothetical protein